MLKYHAILGILNYLIGILVVINVAFFLHKTKPIPAPIFPHPSKWPKDILFLPPPNTNISVTDEEIHEAVDFLNLPIWSRGYIPCHDPKSEVTCSQVVHAYHVIKNWEDYIAKIPIEKRKYFVIKHPVKGLGNKMMTDIVGFVLALMSNRSVLVFSNIPTPQGVKKVHAYEYPPSIFTSKHQLPKSLHSKISHFESIPTNPTFCCFPVNDFILSDRQFVGVDDLLYTPMIYANADTSKWCRENFGIHAAYFIRNYFSRIPKDLLTKAQNYLSTIPPDKKILGVHFRYHRAGQYYSHGLNQSLPVLYEELDRRLSREDFIIGLATDNYTAKDQIVYRYGDRVLLTDALRRPDRDHFSAMVDMAMLIGTSELLVSYRSTYSWIVVTRLGRRAWWIEKESFHCFPASNSQSVGVSMIYHWRDNCNWRTNDRIKYCGKSHRESLQYMFDYIIM